MEGVAAVRPVDEHGISSISPQEASVRSEPLDVHAVTHHDRELVAARVRGDSRGRTVDPRQGIHSSLQLERAARVHVQEHARHRVDRHLERLERGVRIVDLFLLSSRGGTVDAADGIHPGGVVNLLFADSTRIPGRLALSLGRHGTDGTEYAGEQGAALHRSLSRSGRGARLRVERALEPPATSRRATEARIIPPPVVSRVFWPFRAGAAGPGHGSRVSQAHGMSSIASP